MLLQRSDFISPITCGTSAYLLFVIVRHIICLYFTEVKVTQPAMNLISYLHGDLIYITQAIHYIHYIQLLMALIFYVEGITALLL